MQSRQIRKVQHGRHAEHAAGKWQDERKVQLGFIFESWKSLRDKRSDTDPGLAFHLMEIHDQYCFCRFEEGRSTVRDGDPVGSSYIYEQPDDKDEVKESYSKVSTTETTEYMKQLPSLQLPEQQHHSKAETFSRPRDNFDDSSSPVNNETYVTERHTPSLGDSLFPAISNNSPNLPSFGCSAYKTVSMDTPQIPSEPVFPLQMTQNISQQSQDDGALTPSRDSNNVPVKTEPIDVDSESDEPDEHDNHDLIQTDHNLTLISNTEENQRENLQRLQPITDRKMWTASSSAMSEGFKHLIMEELIKSGADIYSGLVPQGTFVRVGSQMHILPRIIEDLWYKFVYARSLSANSQCRSRSRMKKKISKPELEFIAELRTGNPNITEMEIKRRLKQDLNIEVSQPTINRAIRQELMFVKWNHKRWQMHK